MGGIKRTGNETTDGYLKIQQQRISYSTKGESCSPSVGEVTGKQHYLGAGKKGTSPQTIQGTGQQAHLGEIGGLTAIGHSTAALSLELERTFWGDINWLNISG